MDGLVACEGPPFVLAAAAAFADVFRDGRVRGDDLSGLPGGDGAAVGVAELLERGLVSGDSHRLDSAHGGYACGYAGRRRGEGDVAGSARRCHPGIVSSRSRSRRMMHRSWLDGALTAGRASSGRGGRLDSASFTRTRQLASASGAELWALGLVEAGTGHLEQDGRACTVPGGDFALYDTSRPFTWSLAGDWKLRVYTWPRETITLADPESRRLTATVVRGSAGVGRLLSPMLRTWPIPMRAFRRRAPPGWPTRSPS